MTQLLLPLLHHPVYFLVFAAVIGAMVGSFLNVVIYRLPIMLQKDWRMQCQVMLADEHSKLDQSCSTHHQNQSQPSSYNLARPSSHCPKCQAHIKPWHNIPVVSFLLLKGKSACCHEPISWQYPMVEGATALLFTLVAIHFGPTLSALYGFVFVSTMVALSVIDCRTHLLPDVLTQPLLWIGLLANINGLFANGLISAVYGAIAGYMILWLVFWGFYAVTGKEGMGFGDFKLTAALGAWFGWQALPVILLVASLLGTIIGLLMIGLKKHAYSQPLPFGPYLAFSGLIMLFFHLSILNNYLGLVL